MPNISIPLTVDSDPNLFTQVYTDEKNGFLDDQRTAGLQFETTAQLRAAAAIERTKTVPTWPNGAEVRSFEEPRVRIWTHATPYSNSAANSMVLGYLKITVPEANTVLDLGRAPLAGDGTGGDWAVYDGLAWQKAAIYGWVLQGTLYAPKKVARPGYFCIGDSILALENGSHTITGVTVAGGVVTVAITTNGNAVGQRIVLHNCDPVVYPMLNDMFTVATASATQITFAAPVGTPDGTVTAKKPDGSSTSFVLVNQHRSGARATTKLINGFSGNPLRSLGNFACGGDRTGDTIARLDMSIARSNCRPGDYCFISLGSNDFENGASLESYKTNMLAIIDRLETIGVRPVVFNAVPSNTATVPNRALLEAGAAWNLEYARDTGRTHCISSYSDWVDKDSSTGQWVAAYTPDGRHPSNRAALRLALKQSQALTAGLPRQDRFIPPKSGTKAVNAAAACINSNPALLTTSGAGIFQVESGTAPAPTGVAPSNCYLFSRGGNTCSVVSAVSPNATGDANVWQVTFGSGASGDGFKYRFQNTTTALDALLAAGKTYRFSGILRATTLSAASNIRVVQINFNYAVAGFTSGVFASFNTETDATTAWDRPFSYEFSTEPFVMPAGFSAVTPEIFIQASGAGSSVWELESPTFEEVLV